MTIPLTEKTIAEYRELADMHARWKAGEYGKISGREWVKLYFGIGDYTFYLRLAISKATDPYAEKAKQLAKHNVTTNKWKETHPMSKEKKRKISAAYRARRRAKLLAREARNNVEVQ